MPKIMKNGIEYGGGGGWTKTVIWDSGDITSDKWTDDPAYDRYTYNASMAANDKTAILNALNTYSYGNIYIETFFITAGGTRTYLFPIDISNHEFINGTMFGGTLFQYECSLDLNNSLIYNNLFGQFRNTYKGYTYRTKIIAIS